MKKQLAIITLFISSLCNAQIESIELPNGGVDSFNKKTKHYTIHITSNEEIFFNKKRILFWDQISSNILEEVRVPKFNAVQDIVIYADKKLHYYILERVRFEIGKIWQGYVHYIGNGDKKNCLSFYTKGSPLSQKKYDITNWIYGHDVIFTAKQRGSEEGYDESKLKASVEQPIFAIWQPNLMSFFYNGNVNDINKFLNDVNYKGISLVSDEYFICEKKVVSFKEEEKINSLIKNNDILFIYTNFMNFQTYFKGMSNIQSKRYENSNHGVLRKPFIIEISEEYKEELKEKGLNIFNEK